MLSALLLAGACAAPPPSSPPPTEPQDAGPSTVIALVRHAEKAQDDTNDPPLTEAGQARAECLADVLEPLQPNLLWATPFQRTRDTLKPLADRTARSVEVLPALEIDRWADQLRGLPAGSKVVVSAHSNTIPAIVSALGGEPGPLDDSGNIPHEEYDRMLWVVLDASGEHRVTIRQRYCVAPPSQGDGEAVMQGLERGVDRLEVGARQ
jgi:phosphohistidine phosphatase SixA